MNSKVIHIYQITGSDGRRAWSTGRGGRAYLGLFSRHRPQLKLTPSSHSLAIYIGTCSDREYLLGEQIAKERQPTKLRCPFHGPM